MKFGQYFGKVQQEKYFSSKIMQKMRKKDKFQNSVF